MDNMIAQCTQMMSGMTGNGMMGSDMPPALALGASVTGTTTNGIGWASPWYWFGWAWILAILALLVIASIWTIRRSDRSAVEMPLTILRRRYAQGEINSEQFEAVKRQLADGPGSGA